jgi:DNA-binding LacI/PurR family transcriptional regulator
VVNNGPRPVSAETRKRVLVAIEELGYHPHAIARSLKTGNTRTVGLLVQSLIPTFIGRLVNSVEDNLAKWDYGLILASTHEDCDRERHMLDVLATQSLAGLLYIPTACVNSDKVGRLIEEGTPVVFIDRFIPGVNADAVMTDNVAAAKLVTEYLVQQGCKRIICLSFSEEASSALERVEGYRQALEQHGFPFDERMVLLVRYAAGDSVEPALLAYMENYGLPDGILCTTDTFIIEAMRMLRQHSIKVPDQIRVAGGFANAPWNSLMDPPVPLIKQNFHIIAQRAVEFLMDRIEGKDDPPRIERVEAQFDF